MSILNIYLIFFIILIKLKIVFKSEILKIKLVKSK